MAAEDESEKAIKLLVEIVERASKVTGRLGDRLEEVHHGILDIQRRLGWLEVRVGVLEERARRAH